MGNIYINEQEKGLITDLLYLNVVGFQQEGREAFLHSPRLGAHGRSEIAAARGVVQHGVDLQLAHVDRFVQLE